MLLEMEQNQEPLKKTIQFFLIFHQKAKQVPGKSQTPKNQCLPITVKLHRGDVSPRTYRWLDSPSSLTSRALIPP